MYITISILGILFLILNRNNMITEYILYCSYQTIFSTVFSVDDSNKLKK